MSCRGHVASVAGVLSLLSFAPDVQAFSFTLHRRPEKGCSSRGASGRRGTITCGVRRTTGVPSVGFLSWHSQHGSTTSRMATEDSLPGSGGSGAGTGAAAAEADPPDVHASGEASPSEVASVPTEQSEKLRLTAEKLKLQAEKLRLEAEKEQLMLQAEKLQDKESREKKQDKLIAELRSLHGKDEELAVLVQRELKRIDADLFMRLADVAETASDYQERNLLVALSADVMRAVDKVDKAAALKVSRAIKESLDRTEEIERATRAREAAQALLQASNATYSSISASIPNTPGQEGNVSALLDLRGGPSSRVQDLRNLAGMGAGENNSVIPSEVMNVMFLPLWVPTSLLRFVGSAPALLDADMEAVKSQVFGVDTFYVTGMEKSPFAAIYRGNMRGKDSSEVFEAVTSKLESIPGVADRVQLLLMNDPTPVSPEEAMQQRSSEPDPVFMLISKEAAPQRSKALSMGAAAVTLIGTAFTAFAYAIGNFALRPEFYQKINEGDTSVAGLALPIMVGVLALQAIHELGHWAVAGDNKVKIGSPIFIPSLQLGIFGAITPLLSFPKNRTQYFDVAASGPMLGTFLSVAVFVVGILFTGIASPEALATFPLVPAGLFHSSLLIGLITSLALPSVMLQTVTTTVAVHPMAIVGITGIIVNALNLMPIGSLDGGRIAMSTFGRKAGAVLGTATLLLQAVSAVFNNYSLQLFWGLLVILFQRGQDVPAKDELTDVDDGRVAVTIGLFLFSLITLIPFPELL